jgi:phosphoglycerate dehydrogenase-like enzyme
MPRLKVAVAPAGTREFLRGAVTEGGGDVVSPAEADAIVWSAPRDPAGLRALLDAHPNIRWVQLPWAGIEPYLEVLDTTHTWSGGQDVYSAPVAEHVLALVLAGMKDLHVRARATSWGQPSGLELRGARVTLFGAGGIARAFAALLAPFACTLTVVRHDAHVPFQGAQRTLGLADRRAALTDADVVVLALSLTPATRHVIDAQALSWMAPHAWLVNVARGGHVDTDALVEALARGAIRGAALDVTDPEPLAPTHPLWREPRCLITPHCANTPEMAVPLLSERVRENVRRRSAGEPLLGLIDVARGY